MLRASELLLFPVLAMLIVPASHAFDPGNYDLLDLTHVYNDRTIYWPTSPGNFELERLAYGETEAGFFYSANAFCTPEHGGTHLDAPIHFHAGRATVDRLPLQQLLAPAVVIDISDQASADRNYRLTRQPTASVRTSTGAGAR